MVRHDGHVPCFIAMASAPRLWQFPPMDEQLTLAAEFPPATEAEWRKLVEAALKGASFDKRLVSQTYDGLRVAPLYPRAAGVAPVAGRAPGTAWTVMQRVDHPDPAAANAQALQDLENGATGLTLVFAGSLNANGYGLDATPETIARALEGVELDAGITIDFNLSPPTRVAVDHVAALVKARKLDPAAVDLRGSLNPIGGFAAAGASPKPWSELSGMLAGAVRKFAAQGFHGPFVVADGRIIHNAGGSEAQELAFAISAAVDCLRALNAGGVPLDAARSTIYFRLAADADEFLTIAKFRAIRKLWARVEEACGLTPRRTTVAAETAWRMLTKRDPYVNMLRNTIAIAAAGLGGADNIVALPHTAAIGLPDPFARRVARNAQLVLLEESNLAKVADPAAGSGAIEDLTAKLCTAAWALFQNYDKAGGAWAALEQGLVQRDVAAVREQRQANAARRKDAHHRHQRLSEFARGRRARARRAARVATQGSRRQGEHRSIAEHPPRRAVRGFARCLRRVSKKDRRAAEGVPRQSRHAVRFHRARDLRQEFLRGRRHRGARQ